MYFSVFLVIFGLVPSALGNDIELEYHISPPDKVFIKAIYEQYYFRHVKYNGGPETRILEWSMYHMIDKLQPCTKYSFQLRGSEKGTNYKGLVFTKEITTGIGLNPPIRISNVTSDSTSIAVKFNFTQIDCIDSIEMSFNEDTKTYANRDILESITINQMTPCMNYSLVISTVISGHKYLLYQNTVSTKSVEIKPVQNINFDSSTNLLKWDQPLWGALCVSMYTVLLRTDSLHHPNEEICIQTTQPYYEFKMFRPCSSYNVTITPDGRDDLNTTSLFATGYAEPSSVTSLDGNMMSNKTLLEIKWKKPNNNVDCVSNYFITINDEPYETRDDVLVLENRDPCETYEVSVCSSFSRQNCLNKTFTFSNFNEIQLGNITNIASKTTNKTTTITWLPPGFGSKCVQHYLVELYEYKEPNTIRSAFTNSTKIEFTNLIPCADYEVRIQSYGMYRPISLNSIYNIKIEPQKPDQPTQPELIASTATSLTLKSGYKNSNDNCRIQTVRFVCSLHTEILNVTLRNTLKDDTFQVKFANLKPSSNYSCQVLVRNSAEWSDELKTNTVTFTTDTTLTEKLKFNITRTSNLIRISWNNIKALNNQTKILTITKLNHNYDLPGDCISEEFEKTFKVEYYFDEYRIRNLEPATNYSIQIKVNMTNELQKYTKILYASTLPGVPPKVLNAQVTEITVSPSVTIGWDLPCQLNGTVDQFEMKFIGSGIYKSPVHHMDWTINLSEKPNQSYAYTNILIRPDYRYNATITTIRNHSGIINPSGVSIYFLSPPKMIAVYKLKDWGSVRAETDSETQILLKIKPNLKALLNLVHNISVLVTNREYCTDLLEPAYRLYDLDRKIYESPGIASNQNCNKEYRAYLQSSQLIIVRDCANCAQPLKPGGSYHIAVRAYTSRGFADTTPILFETESKTAATLIMLITLFNCLIVAISFGAILWFTKRKINDSRIQIEHKSTQIEVKQFTEQYAALDPNVIEDEFNSSISKMKLIEIKKSVGVKYTTKNRYIDILPYDFNRVVLTPNQFCDVDYINASYINGFNWKHKFIATQGPTIDTAYDYWHMVIEKQCDKIVMVTQLIENEMNKCFQYYPNVNENITFDDLTITNADELNLGMFIRRELVVWKGSDKRLVIHYQFIKWPDHGCPDNEMDLVNFIDFIKNDNSSLQPIVVHCSAGVGRTGTFIALDILMDEILMRAKYIDICGTVKQLRHQRTKSVQTVEQYKFIYSCIDQYLKDLQNS